MYKKKLPHMREANVLKVVVVVLLYYNPDSGTIHYENFSIFQMMISHHNSPTQTLLFF